MFEQQRNRRDRAISNATDNCNKRISFNVNEILVNGK